MSDTNKLASQTFYIRDRWTVDGREMWVRRTGQFPSLSKATAEAKRTAKGIGKGAHVQVVRVATEVVVEVKR